MNLNKIQKLVQKIAETEKVKQVISKVVAAEHDFQKEVAKAVQQVKKTAEEVEKNLVVYKQKAEAQRVRIEKMLREQTENLKKKAQPSKVKKTKKTVKKTSTAHRARRAKKK